MSRSILLLFGVLALGLSTFVLLERARAQSPEGTSTLLDRIEALEKRTAEALDRAARASADAQTAARQAARSRALLERAQGPSGSASEPPIAEGREPATPVTRATGGTDIFDLRDAPAGASELALGEHRFCALLSVSPDCRCELDPTAAEPVTDLRAWSLAGSTSKNCVCRALCLD